MGSRDGAAAPRHGLDHELLGPDIAARSRAPPWDHVAIGRDRAGHHRLAEPEGPLDHEPLASPAGGVDREHHAGTRGLDLALDHDGDVHVGLAEAALGAVEDRAGAEQRGPAARAPLPPPRPRRARSSRSRSSPRRTPTRCPQRSPTSARPLARRPRRRRAPRRRGGSRRSAIGHGLGRDHLAGVIGAAAKLRRCRPRRLHRAAADALAKPALRRRSGVGGGADHEPRGHRAARPRSARRGWRPCRRRRMSSRESRSKKRTRSIAVVVVMRRTYARASVPRSVVARALIGKTPPVVRSRPRGFAGPPRRRKRTPARDSSLLTLAHPALTRPSLPRSRTASSWRPTSRGCSSPATARSRSRSRWRFPFLDYGIRPAGGASVRRGSPAQPPAGTRPLPGRERARPGPASAGAWTTPAIPARATTRSRCAASTSPNAGRPWSRPCRAGETSADVGRLLADFHGAHRVPAGARAASPAPEAARRTSTRSRVRSRSGITARGLAAARRFTAAFLTRLGGGAPRAPRRAACAMVTGTCERSTCSPGVEGLEVSTASSSIRACARSTWLPTSPS